jgi:hypothetical protein
MSDQGLEMLEGSDRVRAFVEDWWGSYEAYGVSADEIVPFGDSVVLTINTQLGRLPGAVNPFGTSTLTYSVLRTGASCAGRHLPTSTKLAQPPNGSRLATGAR